MTPPKEAKEWIGGVPRQAEPSATGWTPAPWEALEQSQGGPMIVQRFDTGNQMNPVGFRLIAHVLQRRDTLATDQANANLIAAAPALYEALVACKAMIDEALPQFNWGKSALSGDAIRLLNETPGKVKAALSLALGSLEGEGK